MAFIYADGPLGAEYLNTIMLDDQFQYFCAVKRIHWIEKDICVLFGKQVGLDYQGTQYVAKLLDDDEATDEAVLGLNKRLDVHMSGLLRRFSTSWLNGDLWFLAVFCI